MLPHLYLYANNIALIAAPSEDVKFYLEEIKSALAFSGLEINEDQTKMFSFSKNPSELDSFDTGGTLGHKMGSRKKRSFKYLGYWFSVYIGKVTLEEELMIMRVEEPSKNVWQMISMFSKRWNYPVFQEMGEEALWNKWEMTLRDWLDYFDIQEPHTILHY